MVLVGYAYDRLVSKSEDADRVRRVLTSARWPRGLSRAQVDHWFPELAPEPELRAVHAAGRVDDATYARLYAESLSEPKRQAALVTLQVLSRHHHLLLLSLRRNVAASHLQVIKRYIMMQPPANLLPS